MWTDIKNLIEQRQSFLLTTHTNPDGDGIGAAAAFTELLIHQGKRVRFVCDSPIPTKFAFLDYHHTHEVYHPENDYRDVEVVIVLDTHKRERIGRVGNLLNNPDIISIVIDHHVPTDLFATYSAIDPEACSAGAMVYALYKEASIPFELPAATGIYTSVICDTGRFSYSCTGCVAHKIAEECIEAGVDPDVMHTRLFQHVTLAQIKVFANALQHMETYFDNHVVIQEIKREDYERAGVEHFDIEHSDLEYIHEFNKLIEDVMCAVLLRELRDNKVRVSIRSSGNFDIGWTMRSLGGGGHRNAAGVTCSGSLADIKAHILGLLKEAIENQDLHFSRV